MRYLGYLVTFLGLLALFSAAPNRSKRQNNSSLVDQCRAIFNVSCDALGNMATPPPLKTEVESTTDAEDCECVVYYQCRADGTPNTDGATVIDRRITQCPGSLDKCCAKSSVLRNGTIDGTATTETPVITPTPIPTRQGCGYRNPGGVSVRITGGEDNQAQFAEFPWMVAVMSKAVPPATRDNYLGGGSLIHPRAILTAAHTIEGKNPATLIVRAGEWDTQERREPIPHQERNVEAILYHENYNTANLHYDFAIVIVKTEFDLAPNVNVMCLPNESDVFDAARCIATGWGKANFEQASKLQAVLKKVELPVVPNDPCQTFLRLTRLGKNFILDPSFVCAGGEPGLDTCTGDGGSPLVCPLSNTPDRYVQAGIVAWGIGCGDDRTPGVYGAVAKARRWIDSKMAQYNLDTSSYVA